MRGKFITVEGVEGVGKTTNLSLIESCLQAHGIDCVMTREPGGTALSEKIRALLLDRENSGMNSMTELLLVFAARAQHVEELIKPALAAGQWVICDRFTDSTFAYQGGGRAMDDAAIKALEQLSIDGFEPDLTLLLDLPVATGMARVNRRSEQDRVEIDRFETESNPFFDRVRDAFLHRAANNPRFRVIDASRPIEVVGDDVRGIIEAMVAAGAD